MNIPLNIDWQQILMHLFNFVILGTGLYILLYKPTIDFMEKRKAYYKKMDDDAKENLLNAEELKKSYDDKLVFVENEIKDMRLKATKEINEKKNKELENAKAEAEKIISDAREFANIEKDKIVLSANDKIKELCALAIEKMAKENMIKNDNKGA